MYKGVFQGIGVILKNEGPKGLFRGIGAAVSGYTFYVLLTDRY